MRYGGSKLKKLEITRFLWYFYLLNGVKSKYKALTVEKSIGSCYTESSSFIKHIR